MPYLPWISDDILESIVHDVAVKVEQALSDTGLEHLQKRIIDPFSLLFEITLLQQSVEDWIENEAHRQLQKTLANAIGDFHQRILGNCRGWVDLGTGDDTGLDLRNEEGTIYAEIKNKYNTMNSSSQNDVFRKMEHVAKHRGATVYLVQIIGKTPGFYNSIWNIKENKNSKIRLISGNAFYELVTRERNAIEQLFTALPTVIINVTDKQPRIRLENNKAVQELIAMQAPQNNGLKQDTVLRYFFDSAFYNSTLYDDNDDNNNDDEVF